MQIKPNIPTELSEALSHLKVDELKRLATSLGFTPLAMNVRSANIDSIFRAFSYDAHAMAAASLGFVKGLIGEATGEDGHRLESARAALHDLLGDQPEAAPAADGWADDDEPPPVLTSPIGLMPISDFDLGGAIAAAVSEAQAAAADRPTKAKAARKASAPAAPSEKMATIIAMLTREGGATGAEMAAATGWATKGYGDTVKRLAAKLGMHPVVWRPEGALDGGRVHTRYRLEPKAAQA